MLQIEGAMALLRIHPIIVPALVDDMVTRPDFDNLNIRGYHTPRRQPACGHLQCAERIVAAGTLAPTLAHNFAAAVQTSKVLSSVKKYVVNGEPIGMLLDSEWLAGSEVVEHNVASGRTHSEGQGVALRQGREKKRRG